MDVFQGPDYYRTRQGNKALVGNSGKGYLTGAILDLLPDGPVAWHWSPSGESEPGTDSGRDLVGLWAAQGR